MAAAVTGFTPLYGLHLNENRTGDILFKVTAKLETIADYGALGNYVGKMIGERLPVFDGLMNPTTEELVYFGAALASAGGVAMFHAIGVTPDAPDLETVFKGKKYETIELGQKELEQGYENLTSAKSRDVDFVAMGCPHCSLNQVANLARMLQGRKIKEGHQCGSRPNMGSRIWQSNWFLLR